jgi:two-component system, OmpR family, phosphate regulon sensor histidine kinase PhoR
MTPQTLTALVVIGIAAVAVLLALIRAQRLEAELAATREAVRQQTQTLAIGSTAAGIALKQRDAVFDAAQDPILVIDVERKITALNPAAHELGVFTTGRSLIESSRSFELDALADPAHSTGLPRELMLNNRLYRASIARGDEQAVIVLRDISELTRLGRARRDFVANISHELRTPLTAIRLLLDTLTGAAPDQQPLTPEQRRLLDQISDQTGALTQMTQEISDLAQIESGQLPMRLVPCALHDAVDGVFARLAPQANRAQLALVNETPEALNALVDPVQLQRVLLNLVQNAIKFTPRGGITISATPADVDWVQISVRDTGDGIPADEINRIFERFYKVDRARGQSGTGLGLAIVKHIVEAHGGRIWVESTLGAGATFHFTVPAP